MACLLIVLTVFYEEQKSRLSVFSVACGFGVVAKKFLSNSGMQRFPFMFSSKRFFVLDLKFRSILS